MMAKFGLGPRLVAARGPPHEGFCIWCPGLVCRKYHALARHWKIYGEQQVWGGFLQAPVCSTFSNYSSLLTVVHSPQLVVYLMVS